MGKAILMSVIVATIVVPTLAARDRNGRRGLKRMLVFLIAFNLLYVLLVALVYTTYFEPELW